MLEVAEDVNLDAPIADVEALLAERGLSPAEWIVTGCVVNKWGQQGAESTQLKVRLASKGAEADVVLPARIDGPKYKPAKVKTYKRKPRRVVFTSDHHAPFHDEHLHQLFLAWLSEHKPEEGVVMGDLLDFPSVSRHRHSPEWAATVNDCLEGGYRILRDYREASPDTAWQMIPGNHSDRLRNSVLDQHEALFGIARAGGDSVLEVPYLLRLDELGIQWVDPLGSYDHGQVVVSPGLVARHGNVAKRGAGQSALKTLEQIDHSVFIGHVHRQALLRKTIYNADGAPKVLTACEVGCMARLEQGLGYAPKPDWAQGFGYAAIHPNGEFGADLGVYKNGVLLFRDECYR